MNPNSGRVIAWLSFTLGILVSVAGNIAHATSNQWSWPEVGGSAFWPLALMLSIEILTRTDWEVGRRWVVARFAGLIAVATVAAVLSYRHLAGLMTSWGEDWLNAHLGPFAVDGLMLLAATALLSISRKSSRLAAESEAAKIAAEAKAEARMAARKPKLPRAADLSPTPDPVSTQSYVEAVGEIVGVEETKPSPLHVVNSVPKAVAEEAARQAWINSGKQLSSTQVAALANTSKATAHRRIQRWSQDTYSR